MSEERPWTMSVPAAGKKYFGLERAASYNAAKTGMIPTIRIGRKLRALPVAIERMLEQAATQSPPQAAHTKHDAGAES